MNVTWYLPPLALAISLVYSASRYELPQKILTKALSLFLQITVFMGLIMLVLHWLSYAL